MIYTWKDICPVEIEAMLFMFENPKSTLIHFPNTRIESQGTLVDLEALHSLRGIKPLCTNSTSVVSIYWVPCVLSGQINTTLEHNDCHHEVCVKMCVADRWGVCGQPLIRPPAPLPTPPPLCTPCSPQPLLSDRARALVLWCSQLKPGHRVNQTEFKGKVLPNQRNESQMCDRVDEGKGLCLIWCRVKERLG